MDKVVRCNVFLMKMSDFSSMNEVYATFFREDPPVRTTVAVAQLPKDALIEIQVTAVECRLTRQRQAELRSSKKKL